MSGLGFPHLPEDAWRLYLGDEGSGELLARVDAHVAECPECSRHLLQLDPSRAFRQLRTPAPAATWDGFWEELEPQLDPAAPAKQASWDAGSRLRRHLAVAASLAAALALIAFLVGIPNEPPAEQAAEDPCTTAAVAKLRLTKAECEALYSGPIEAPDADVVVIRGVDLRGL